MRGGCRWIRLHVSCIGQVVTVGLVVLLKKDARLLMVDIGKKLWGFCHTLRHTGISHIRYIELLTYLLFLKMASERNLQSLHAITCKELEGD